MFQLDSLSIQFYKPRIFSFTSNFCIISFFFKKIQICQYCRATHVPTGEDQVQQLQLAQHLAKVFNHKFGDTFPIIEPLIGDDASGRIRSLVNPAKKQSKSDPNDKSRITLRDSPNAILKKIKRAITDFTSEVTYDPDNRPGVANLVGIHALVKNVSPEQICNEASGLDTGKYVFNT